MKRFSDDTANCKLQVRSSAHPVIQAVLIRIPTSDLHAKEETKFKLSWPFHFACNCPHTYVSHNGSPLQTQPLPQRLGYASTTIWNLYISLSNISRTFLIHSHYPGYYADEHRNYFPTSAVPSVKSFKSFRDESKPFCVACSAEKAPLNMDIPVDRWMAGRIGFFSSPKVRSLALY